MHTHQKAIYPDGETAQWATRRVVTENEQVIHRWSAGSRASHTQGLWVEFAEHAKGVPSQPRAYLVELSTHFTTTSSPDDFDGPVVVLP